MTNRFRPLALTVVLCSFAVVAIAAPAPHDLKVELKQLNAPGGKLNYPGPVKFEMKVTNLGPVAVTGSYKMLINKYDHTGQRWLKSVFTRDLPLLSAPGGDLTYFTYLVEDTAGAAITDAGTTFIYRAFIGPGVYSDPVAVNNKSEVGIRFLKTTASNATQPLFETAFIPAGSELDRAETEATR